MSTSTEKRGLQVPEFEKKIDLLFRRGGYAYDASERRFPVCDRPSLAEALNVDQAQLTRWIKGERIPRIRNAIKLAGIFSIECEWLSEPCEVFGKLFVGTKLQSPWVTLLNKAKQDDVGTIIQNDPPPLRALAARPESTVNLLPAVERGSLITVRLKMPLSNSGSVLWGGWHVTLLSEDPDGFVCLLPRFVGTPEFPHTTHTKFQRAPWFECSGLRMDNTITGDHAFVLIATKEPWPAAINTLLMADNESDALLPTLDRLAAYLAPLCPAPKTKLCAWGTEATAAVHRLRFRVK